LLGLLTGIGIFQKTHLKIYRNFYINKLSLLAFVCASGGDLLIQITMKTLIYIIFIILPFSLVCQNSFELTIKTDIDDFAKDILQLDDGSYICVGSSTDNVNDRSQGIIFKISQEGSIIHQVNIIKPDTLVYIDVLDTINGNFVACGRVTEIIQNEHFSSIYLYFFNSDLELIYEKIINLPPEYTLAYYRMMKTDGDNIFVSGEARHRDFQTYMYDVFIYEFDAIADSITANFILREGIQFAEGYLLLPDNEGHYIFSFGTWEYNQGMIIKYDAGLNIIETDTLPSDLLFDNYAMNLPSGNYLLSSRQWFDTSPGVFGGEEMRSVLYDMQRPNIPIKSYEYHMGTDSLSFPAALRSFDTTNMGEIYFSGTANVDGRTYPWQEYPSWIFLSKLDENLGHQWTKFYGGDMFYHIYTVKATQDGGAIMACRTYDYETQYWEHDIIIFKVDEDGLITGLGDEPAQIIAHDAIIYPNPGSSYLKVESGPQIDGAEFELFDMTGKMAARETLNSRLLEINTSHLPTGNYTYRITWQNRLMGSGKWVKH